MDAYIGYALLSLVIGGLLLFYGAYFVKLTAGLIGGVIGYSLGTLVFNGISWNSWLEFIIVVIIALAVASFAMNNYLFFVRASVAYAVGALVHGSLIAANVDPVLTMMLAVGIGIFTYVIIDFFGLVVMLFKIMTAFLGATLVTSGFILLFDKETFAAFQDGYVAHILGSTFGWILLWFGLTIYGYFTQSRYRTVQGA